jgi:hypothetical protein
VEADVSQTYAVVAITSFFFVAIALLRCAAPWNDILKESGRRDEDDSKSVAEGVPEGVPQGERNEADEEYDETK